MHPDLRQDIERVALAVVDRCGAMLVAAEARDASVAWSVASRALLLVEVAFAAFGPVPEALVAARRTVRQANADGGSFDLDRLRALGPTMMEAAAAARIERGLDPSDAPPATPDAPTADADSDASPSDATDVPGVPDLPDLPDTAPVDDAAETTDASDEPEAHATPVPSADDAPALEPAHAPDPIDELPRIDHATDARPRSAAPRAPRDGRALHLPRPARTAAVPNDPPATDQPSDVPVAAPAPSPMTVAVDASEATAADTPSTVTPDPTDAAPFAWPRAGDHDARWRLRRRDQLALPRATAPMPRPPHGVDPSTTSSIDPAGSADAMPPHDLAATPPTDAPSNTVIACTALALADPPPQDCIDDAREPGPIEAVDEAAKDDAPTNRTPTADAPTDLEPEDVAALDLELADDAPTERERTDDAAPNPAPVDDASPDGEPEHVTSLDLGPADAAPPDRSSADAAPADEAPQAETASDLAPTHDFAGPAPTDLAPADTAPPDTPPPHTTPTTPTDAAPSPHEDPAADHLVVEPTVIDALDEVTSQLVLCKNQLRGAAETSGRDDDDDTQFSAHVAGVALELERLTGLLQEHVRIARTTRLGTILDAASTHAGRAVHAPPDARGLLLDQALAGELRACLAAGIELIAPDAADAVQLTAVSLDDRLTLRVSPHRDDRDPASHDDEPAASTWPAALTGLRALAPSLRIEPGPRTPAHPVGPCLEITARVRVSSLQTVVCRAAGHLVAIPVRVVDEVRQVTGDAISTRAGEPLLDHRGRLLSILDVGTALGVPLAVDPTAACTAVVVEHDGHAAALRVDDVIGREEVVPKPVGYDLDPHHPVAGATVRADGGIALILDVGNLLAAPRARPHAPATSHEHSHPHEPPRTTTSPAA